MSLFSQELDLTEDEKKWIKQNPIVYFGYDNNWPPYEIYRDGKYLGICNDFIQIISKKTGITDQAFQQVYQQGGIFVKLENEWKDSIKQRNVNTRVVKAK